MSFSCPPGADLEVAPFTNLLLSQVKSGLAIAIAVPQKPSLGLGFTSLQSASALLMSLRIPVLFSSPAKASALGVHIYPIGQLQ